MTFDQIINTLKYLGHHTHDQEGRITPIAAAVARSLQGGVLENITLSPTLATEWRKFAKCEICQGRTVRIESVAGRDVPLCDECFLTASYGGTDAADRAD